MKHTHVQHYLGMGELYDGIRILDTVLLHSSGGEEVQKLDCSVNVPEFRILYSSSSSRSTIILL